MPDYRSARVRDDVEANPGVHGFKDPHVFPYVVKGFKRSTSEVKYESRRSMTEAGQTVARFTSEGFHSWIFELKELTAPPEGVADV